MAQPLFVEDMTRGFRFEPPLLSITESPLNPNQLLVGNQNGRLYISTDRGESWLENNVLIRRLNFLGSTYRHHSLRFEPMYFLKQGVLPSPGQAFSFQNLIDLKQKLPQAAGLVRSYFNAGIYGNPYTSGFIRSYTSRRASWRLNSTVRKKKGWGLGVKWRTQISAKSSNKTGIRFVVAHPTKPQELLAATDAGLHHSKDGGDSWPLTLSGASRKERSINIIHFHPDNSEEIWVGTQGGLRISKNGGETYQIPASPLINGGNIQWIAFNPKNSQEVYIGVSWALLKSTDGGNVYKLIFIRPWPALSYVQRVLIDPHNTDRVLLGTRDGLMLSVDQGKTFERAGGLLFVGQPIVSVISGFYPRHYLVATSRDLWQSFDGGETWQVAYFGAINWDIRMVIISKHTANMVWILTTAEILKMSLKPSQSLNLRKLENFKARVAREPSMSLVISRALKQAGVYRKDRLRLRKKARISALLPILDVGWAYRQAKVPFDVINLLVANQTNEITNFNDAQFDYSIFGVFAWWNLHKLIFHRGELPYGRGESMAKKLEYKIRTLVINMYQERRTLMQSLMLNPIGGRTRLMRMLRFEELTAHLNQISDGSFPPFNALYSFKSNPF